MNCSKVQPNLLDYSRGLLNPREANAIRAHLEDCPECSLLLAQEIQLADRLSASPKPAPQSDVWLRVESRIGQESRKQNIFELLHVSFARRMAVVTALVAVLIIALFTFAPWNGPNATAEQESVRQAVALMQVQPTPENMDAGTTTDTMMKVLDDEL